MIQKNDAKIEENFEINYGLIQTNKEKTEDNKNLINELSNLVQTNEDDIEGKVQSNTADLEILNTKVIFNAQKTEGGNVRGNLTFDRVDINIGDGFDGSSGVFKVPVTGIYK